MLAPLLIHTCMNTSALYVVIGDINDYYSDIAISFDIEINYLRLLDLSQVSVKVKKLVLCYCAYGCISIW